MNNGWPQSRVAVSIKLTDVQKNLASLCRFILPMTPFRFSLISLNISTPWLKIFCNSSSSANEEDCIMLSWRCLTLRLHCRQALAVGKQKRSNNLISICDLSVQQGKLSHGDTVTSHRNTCNTIIYYYINVM